MILMNMSFVKIHVLVDMSFKGIANALLAALWFNIPQSTIPNPNSAELKMRKVTMTITAIFLDTLLMACASTETIKKGETDAKKPVNCAAAEGDIRVLQSEKTHADQQMPAGVSAISPAGIVVGTITNKEITNAKVATGDYNRMLDYKIAEIKRECGMK
jgi:hypothetical protein